MTNTPLSLAAEFLRAVGGERVEVSDQRWAKRNQVRSVFGDQTEFHQRFWQSVNDLDAMLSRAGLDHLYIKTVRSFRSDDSNIDVVFKTEDAFQRARALAEQAGRSATYSYHEPDKVMYRLYQGKTEQKPAWHFHRGVTWNGVPYLGNAELFESRQRVEHEGLSLEVPSPEHAVMIYAGHALFENYVIPLGELYDVSVFSQEVQNWEAIYALARQNGWEGALKGYICLARGLSKRFGIENALPDLGVSRLRSGSLPYRVPWGLETKAFHGRISHNLRARQFRRAFRELYAYPAFFALEQVKLLLGYA